MSEEDFIRFCLEHYYDEDETEYARKIFRERPDVSGRPDWVHSAVCEMANSRFWQVELSVNDALEYTKAIEPFEKGYIDLLLGINEENREQKAEEYLDWFTEWLAKDDDETDEEPEPFAEKGDGFDAYAVALNAIGDQLAREDHCIVIGKATMEPGMDYVALRVSVTSPKISDKAERLMKYAGNLCDRVEKRRKYGNPFLEFELEVSKSRV